MKLVRLIYYSRASREMSLSDLKDILGTARDNNNNLDICGMLCYDQQYFLQVLEGERSAVNELYLEIADDPRHHDIVIISYNETTKTIFPQWQMGYAGSSAQFSQILEKLGQTVFSPVDMDKDMAIKFLYQMSNYQSKV